MLCLIVLLKDPWPLTETQLSDTGPYIALQNSLVVFRFHDAMHTVKASGARSSNATPKHLWTSAMFDRRDLVLFFEGLMILSMLFHNFCSQIIRQFFALLSFIHAQYGTHRHTTQSQRFSILTGCKWDLYVSRTCYLPQVSLNTN